MSPHVLKGARNVFEQTRAENETKYPERQSMISFHICCVIANFSFSREALMKRRENRRVRFGWGEKKRFLAIGHIF